MVAHYEDEEKYPRMPGTGMMINNGGDQGTLLRFNRRGVEGVTFIPGKYQTSPAHAETVRHVADELAGVTRIKGGDGLPFSDDPLKHGDGGLLNVGTGQPSWTSFPMPGTGSGHHPREEEKGRKVSERENADRTTKTTRYGSSVPLLDAVIG